jgi:hypothetical protein
LLYIWPLISMLGSSGLLSITLGGVSWKVISQLDTFLSSRRNGLVLVIFDCFFYEFLELSLKLYWLSYTSVTG